MILTIKHVFAVNKKRKSINIKEDNYFEQQNGIVTVQYPKEKMPIPEVGRYQLHVEIDDCIVCDLCAKICPVDCIEIESIKATGPIGQTSDGTTKRLYAAKFDIDMGKCCFCGLCTTVCPTECLTMTKVFDFSVYDMQEHNFAFSEMTPAEIEEKKKIAEEHQKSKLAAKPPLPTPTAGDAPKTAAKPVFRPKIKPAGPPPPTV